MAAESGSYQPQPQVIISSPTSLSRRLLPYILGFIGPFLVVFIIALLNYFNVLPLSLLYPKQLGFLPHKSFAETFPGYQQTSNIKQIPSKLAYACPLKKDSCLTGTPVNLTMARPVFWGLAYQNLASGSAVLAVIPGKYSSGVSIGKTGEKNIILTVTNNVFNIEIDYQFKGQAYLPTGVGNGSVKSGDTIGWTTDDVLDQGLFDKQYQLIMSARDLKTKEFIKLNPEALMRETP